MDAPVLTPSHLNHVGLASPSLPISFLCLVPNQTTRQPLQAFSDHLRAALDPEAWICTPSHWWHLYLQTLNKHEQFPRPKDRVQAPLLYINDIDVKEFSIEACVATTQTMHTFIERIGASPREHYRLTLAYAVADTPGTYDSAAIETLRARLQQTPIAFIANNLVQRHAPIGRPFTFNERPIMRL